MYFPCGEEELFLPPGELGGPTIQIAKPIIRMQIDVHAHLAAPVFGMRVSWEDIRLLPWSKETRSTFKLGEETEGKNELLILSARQKLEERLRRPSLM